MSKTQWRTRRAKPWEQPPPSYRPAKTFSPTFSLLSPPTPLPSSYPLLSRIPHTHLPTYPMLSSGSQKASTSGWKLWTITWVHTFYPPPDDIGFWRRQAIYKYQGDSLQGHPCQRWVESLYRCLDHSGMSTVQGAWWVCSTKTKPQTAVRIPGLGL